MVTAVNAMSVCTCLFDKHGCGLTENFQHWSSMCIEEGHAVSQLIGHFSCVMVFKTIVAWHALPCDGASIVAKVILNSWCLHLQKQTVHLSKKHTYFKFTKSKTQTTYDHSDWRPAWPFSVTLGTYWGKELKYKDFWTALRLRSYFEHISCKLPYTLMWVICKEHAKLMC